MAFDIDAKGIVPTFTNDLEYSGQPIISLVVTLNVFIA